MLVRGETGIRDSREHKESKQMGVVRTAARRFGIASELVLFFAGHRRWRMLPLIVVVLLAGILIILAQSSALAPFFYPLF